MAADERDKITLTSAESQALVVAANALAERSDYNKEQRSLANYDVWIYREDGNVIVSFLSIPRKGDENVIGGNFPYARAVKYVIEPKSFKVLKTVGSK